MQTEKNKSKLSGLTGFVSTYFQSISNGSDRFLGTASHTMSLVLDETVNTGVRAASFNTIPEPLKENTIL